MRSRRPDLRFTWNADDSAIGYPEAPDNFVGDALSRAAVRQLETYSSFCNQTQKPNGTVCSAVFQGESQPANASTIRRIQTPAGGLIGQEEEEVKEVVEDGKVGKEGKDEKDEKDKAKEAKRTLFRKT